MSVKEDGKYREKYTDEMDLNELVDWARGYLPLEIGKGKFPEAFWTIVYQAYIKGRQDGKS